MAKLSNMKINAVALCDRGANLKTFYLKKKEDTMTKELLLAILSGNLSAEQVAALIAQIPEADRAEVQAIVDEQMKSKTEATSEVDQVAEKVNKATADQIKTLVDQLDAMKKVIESLAEKAPAEAPAEKAKETPEAPVAKEEDKVTKTAIAKEDEDISQEEFEKMLKTAFVKA